MQDLEGHWCDWKPRSSKRKRSGPHEIAFRLVQLLFPAESILEEVKLPRMGGLRLDIFLPIKKIAFEVQGRQHYQLVKHFHGDVTGFMRSKLRDFDKRSWCELNGITLVELPAGEDEHKWALRIGSEAG